MDVTYRFEQKDAVEFLRGLDDESVSLIITDPSYESLEKHRSKGTTTRLSNSKSSSNDWFEIFPNDRFPGFFEECYRVLKPDAHLYMFSDDETAYVAKPAAESAGFRYWKQIIWVKMVNDGSRPATGMGYHYRAANERILFFEKGKRALNDLSVRDVLMFPRIWRGYPTEKPVDLMRVLVTQSTDPGEVVVDPFMGSCPVGLASIDEGRSFIGNDLSPTAFDIAHTRARALVEERLRLEGEQDE